MKIGEVAARTGLTVDTVRFYERRGLIPCAPRQPSGYRHYTDQTVDRLLLARRLKGLGLTIEEIVDALHAHDQGTASCASERWRLEVVRERIDAKLGELRTLRATITETLEACEEGRCPISGDRANNA